MSTRTVSPSSDAVKAPVSTTNQAHTHDSRKAQLVDLGLWCLSRGEWRIVQALTCLVQREGLKHE